MKPNPISLGLIALGTVLSSAHAQITTSAFVSADALAGSLLSGSAGITIHSASYVGVEDASGFFTSTPGLLPFQSGLVLTTGSRSSVEGLNTAGDVSVENFAAGDADLDNLAGVFTYDAAVLEIRFTPTNNVISFQYAFGSEEYNEWVGGANDVFGFFLNGTNIARLPGGGADVSILSVNNGASSEYYYDNELGFLPTQLDGFGGINPGHLFYAMGAVNPGVENVLRIAIGDVSDGALDSAVFIAAGSLIDSTPVPEPSTYAVSASLLLVALMVIRRRVPSIRQS